MSAKRKSAMTQSPAKRPRLCYDDESEEKKPTTPHEKPRSHPLYGQKNAFPGLDDGGDELCYGDGETDDVFEYLRMVRSEADALPALLTAKNSKSDRESATPILSTSEPKAQAFPPGFFDQEQAYIAPAEHKNVAAAHKDPYPEAQASYNNLLRHRFLLLRSTLKCSPPATSIAALDDAHPISLPRKVEAARKDWRRLVMSVEPQMVQLACMDMDSVLGVLQIMARMMSDVLRSEDSVQIRRLGAWAWGLLGKCREVGELSTEEVGEIRDIGKRAVKILQKIREADIQQAQDEEASDWDAEEEYQPADVDQEVDVDGPVEGDMDQADQQEAEGKEANDSDPTIPDETDQDAELEAARARLQAKFQESVDDDAAAEESDYVAKQTRAMLDMIIMVVGEFFGQRDLLDSREVWVTAG